jgi:3-isopropylmalate dehydrogenase
MSEARAKRKGLYRIACIPGDGIGPEVTAQARRTADAAAARGGFRLEWTEYPYGAGHYLSTGEILPHGALEALADSDALYLGAIGDPRVAPGLLERGILLRLRFHFDQYVNLRPARSYAGVPTPVRIPEGRRIDTVVVRENTEDLYLGLGAVAVGAASGPDRLDLAVDQPVGPNRLSGHLALALEGTPGEPPRPRGTDPSVRDFSASLAVETRPGVERIARYAFETARRRGEKEIVLATKANAVPHLYGYFESVVVVVARDYPDVALRKENVDALCYRMVREPERYGTILCPNLFGDIVSDLAAGICGGMGVAPGANLGDRLSLFEPVHGSAPDIAGTGRANPLAAILAAALMLEHLGEADAARAVEAAVEADLREAPAADRPFEFGGSASCTAVGERIARRIG